MHTMPASTAPRRKRLAREAPLERLLQPRCVSADRGAPGVIMLKIDGLSRHQFQRALDHGRLPYLARLLAGGRYGLKSFYPGLPSTTPVVQAELFFGVRTSAPAITFYDRAERKMHNLLMPSSAEALARKLEKRGRPLLADGTHIAALGPLGHIYLAGARDASRKKNVAEALVQVAKIPLVLYNSGEAVVALTRRGAWRLEAQPRTVLGSDHPFARWAAEDLAAACRHPQAGDIVISGWRPDGPPLTFAFENGAHGGPGREETRAFVLLPKEMDRPSETLRPTDLRQAVLALRATGANAQQGDKPFAEAEPAEG